MSLLVDDPRPHMSFRFPAQLASSYKYMSLSGPEFRRFVIFLCVTHAQGGVVVNQEEVRIAMGLTPKPFHRLMAKLVDQEFVREVDNGYEPFDLCFGMYVPLDLKKKRQAQALWRGKRIRRRHLNKYSHLPLVRRRSFRLVDFLSQVAGVSYVKTVGDRPTSAILRIEESLKNGEMTVLGYKNRIASIAQNATSEKDRVDKLKPSKVF